MPANTPTTPARALAGAAMALEMCSIEHSAQVMFPDAFAKAAVTAYLNLTGREAEAVEVARVGT